MNPDGPRGQRALSLAGLVLQSVVGVDEWSVVGDGWCSQQMNALAILVTNNLQSTSDRKTTRPCARTETPLTAYER